MKTTLKSTAPRKGTQGTERTKRTRTKRRTKEIPTGKPRCDSTLDGLSPERKEQLAGWLVDENRGYVDVCKRVGREWGVRTSRSALSRYYRRWLVPEQLAEAEEAAEVMDQVDRESFGEAALRRAQQLGFMALMEPEPDWKAARVYLGIADAIERRELARERVELSERLVKLRELRDTPPPSPPPLTEDEYWEKCNSIFGLEYGYRSPQVLAERAAAEAAAKAASAAGAQAGAVAITSTITIKSTSGEVGGVEADEGQAGRSKTAPLQLTEGTGVGAGNETGAGAAGIPGSSPAGSANPEVFSAGEQTGGRGGDANVAEETAQSAEREEGRQGGGAI